MEHKFSAIYQLHIQEIVNCSFVLSTYMLSSEIGKGEGDTNWLVVLNWWRNQLALTDSGATFGMDNTSEIRDEQSKVVTTLCSIRNTLSALELANTKNALSAMKCKLSISNNEKYINLTWRNSKTIFWHHKRTWPSESKLLWTTLSIATNNQ